jgi:ABC-type transporter Mla subunit MlaD
MGGILDTWVTVFQSDTKSVDDGNKKAALSADALIHKLKATDTVAAKTGSSMAGFITGAAGALAGFLAAKASISGVFESATMIVALQQTSDALGETIENVDAFGKAAEAAGGDAQGARDSLTDLAEKMGEAMSDAESGAAKAFKALHVGLKDTEGNTKGAVAGMLDLAAAVEKLPKNEAVFKIKELGITDNRTVEMLLKGRTELERLLAKQKEQGVVTKENAEQALKFKSAWNELSAGFDRAGLSISTGLMPYFTKAIDALVVGFDWLEDHKDLVAGFFIAIGAIVAVAYVPPMMAAAAATIAATWPILAIGAAIIVAAAAFALIYDDIMNFIDGNDSFIGQMVEKYPLVKALVDGVAVAFKFLGQMAGDVWRAITVGFQQMIEFIMRGIKQIASGVSTVAKFFGIGGGDDEQAGPQEPEGRARPSGSGQDASDVPGNDTVRMGQQQLALAGASPLNSTTSSAISNANSNSKVENNLSVGELNVNAPQATDAAGIAQGSTDALDKQLKSMQESSANGRAR